MREKMNKFLTLLPESMQTVVKKHAGLLGNYTPESLKNELREYFEKISQEAGGNPDISLQTIQKMVATFKALIELFPDFDAEEKAIAYAAIKYFVDSEDAQLDFEDPFGFDDDLAVLNAALLALDHEEMVVQR